MRKLLLLLVLCSLMGCATTQSAIKDNASFVKYQKVYLRGFDDDPRNVLPKVEDRLKKLGFHVVVVPEDKAVGGNQGTGFVLTSDGYVLTSGHVIGKEKEATLWLKGKRYEAEVVHVVTPNREDTEEVKDQKKSRNVQDAIQASLNSKENRSVYEDITEKDFALLKIRSADTAFAPISIAGDGEYKMGQDVYTIGFPLSNILGDNPRLTKGLVSSTVGPKDNPEFVQISAEIQPGNSGGPLLNEKGQLVGMVQMTLNPLGVLADTGNNLPQNVNFAVKYKAIKEFLSEVESAGKAKLALRQGAASSFDEVQNTIVQVRSGNVPEDFKDEAKLVCTFSYTYFWDMWYRFQVFDIVFHDFDTQEALLRAGQYGDNPFSNEDSTLDDTFKEIKKKMGK